MALRIVDPALISVKVADIKNAVDEKYVKKVFGIDVFSTLKAAVAYAYGGDTIELKSGQYRLFNDDLTLAWDNHSYEKIGDVEKKDEVGGPVGRLSGDWPPRPRTRRPSRHRPRATRLWRSVTMTRKAQPK